MQFQEGYIWQEMIEYFSVYVLSSFLSHFDILLEYVLSQSVTTVVSQCFRGTACASFSI